MFSKLFFNKKIKKDPKSFSFLFLYKEIHKFTKKSSYTTKDLKHFESLYGLILLKQKQILIVKALNSLLKNLENNSNYINFISKILLSTFKTKDTYIISKVIHVLSNHNVFIDKKNKDFQINLYKIFFISVNACKENNPKLIKIILHSSYFSWIFKDFNFEYLLNPCFYKLLKKNNNNIYYSVINSFISKINYNKERFIENDNIIALKNNNLNFFNNDYSNSIYEEYKFLNKEYSIDFIFNSFFNFIVEHKFAQARNILNLKKEINHPKFNFFSNKINFIHSILENTNPFNFDKNLFENFKYDYLNILIK